MTQRKPSVDRPLEETPEVVAAVEDETTVPQLVTGGDDQRRSTFREPGDVAEYPPTEQLIGDAQGGGGSGGPGRARTGAEQPWDPEDLAAADGRDPTPRNVERARQELAERGAAAIERTVP